MDQLDDLLKRPKYYNNIDGVGELGIGFMCLAYALLGWEQVHSPEHSFWNQPYTFFVYLSLMVAIIHYGSKAIKERITFPRTGRVEYRRRDTVCLPMILGAAVSGGMVALVVAARRGDWSLASLVPLFGLVLAGIYANGIARRVPWKWTVACFMAFGSIWIATLPAHTLSALVGQSWITRSVSAKIVASSWLIMTLYGALLFVSGGISFCIYLRQNPRPAQEEQ